METFYALLVICAGNSPVSFALLPRVLDEQHPSRPVIIPIITRNSQIREIFTEIRTV